MKLLFLSDIHGVPSTLEAALKMAEGLNPDRIVLLGDLLYHGPRNGVPSFYDPERVVEILNGLRDRIIAVRGNCDAEVDQAMFQFPMMSDYALLDAGAETFFLTHGHVFNTSHLPPLCPGDILLHGHTHIPAWEPFGEGNLYLNPGSVSIPKEGSHHQYILMDGSTFTMKDLDGTPLSTITLD